MCTRQSRKIIWDMINRLFLTTVAVEPTFVAFLSHSQTHFHGLSCQFFQISLKKRELKTTHNAFDKLSRALFPTTFLEIAVYSKHTDQTMCQPQNWSQSLTRDSSYRGLTERILVSCIGGRLWEVVGYRRWSYMDIQNKPAQAKMSLICISSLTILRRCLIFSRY